MKTKNIITVLGALSLSLLLLVSGCKQKPQADAPVAVEAFDFNEVRGKILALIDKVMEERDFSEVQTYFTSAGLAYYDNIPLELSRADKMLTTAQKCFASGIYDFDIIYAAVFGKTNQMRETVAVKSKITSELGLPSFFVDGHRELVNEVIENSDNPDKINQALAEFLAMDNVDKSQPPFANTENVGVFDYIFLSTLVESFHIYFQAYQQTDNKAGILGLINHHKDLVTLVYEVMTVLKDDPVITPIYEAYKPVAEAYAAGPITEANVIEVADALVRVRNLMLNS